MFRRVGRFPVLLAAGAGQRALRRLFGCRIIGPGDRGTVDIGSDLEARG